MIRFCALLLLFSNVILPDLGHPLYEEIEIGIGRDFEGKIKIGNVTDAELCFVCSCLSTESSECGGRVTRREWLKPEAGMECFVTDWDNVCINTTDVVNATTDVSFETPHANRFLQFPAATGRVISSGNLEDVTSIGVQGTPIMGFSRRLKDGQQSVTHIQFGAHENEPWPPSAENCLAMGCSPTDPNLTNTPSELFGCFCSPDVEWRDTELWKSHTSRAELLYSTSRPAARKIGNQLKFPSTDGVLLSTGNLEDVTLDGSSMTGLNISDDLHIHGWLQFGSGQHADSCDWTKCSDESHLRTTGILVDANDAKDLTSGWQYRSQSICSESDLGVPVGSLELPSEWAALDDTCWDSVFGSYCFKFQQSSVEECFKTCTGQSCSIITASRFQLVQLNLSSATSIQLEKFAAPCRPDPLNAGKDLCLITYRVPRVPAAGLVVQSMQDREYLSGGKDFSLGWDIEEKESNVTRALQGQLEVISVYKCLDRACNLARFSFLSVTSDHLPLMEFMTYDHCDQFGWSFENGVTFNGNRLQCNTISQAFSPCPDNGAISSNCGMTLLSFPTKSLALPTVSSLQQVYNDFTILIDGLNADLEPMKALFAISGASVPFTRVPYLWQEEVLASIGKTKTLQLRRYGYCDRLTAVSETTFSCGMDKRIQSIDFASFGSASGFCGNLSIGRCAIDVLPDLKACEGQKNCTVDLPLIAAWNEALTARATSCDETSSAGLEFQVRCTEGPLIAVLDATLGVLHEAKSHDGPGSANRAQVFNQLTALHMRDSNEVLCAIATANPPLIQAHMCAERMVPEVDTYVYKGFEAEVTMLIESENDDGRKTVLRMQSLADSNHSVSETQVLFAATNGILLSSGNLHDITAESGSLTSVAVKKRSFLQGGVTVGAMHKTESYSHELKENVQDSWWAGLSEQEGTVRSPAEGGSRWDWSAGGPWLTVFGNGDCQAPQSTCTTDNVDRSIKFNTSDGDLTRIDFEVLHGVMSQIAFPVTWGIRQGEDKPHSYSEITGGRYTLLPCSPEDVLHPNASNTSAPECLSRVITTGNLADIRNLSAETVTVRGSSVLAGPILLGSGQSIAQLPVAYRGPPGDFGRTRPLDAYAWQSTFFDAWHDSTSSGLNDCKRASDPQCGGSSSVARITPIAIDGSIRSDLFYRDVPRNRKPEFLHSSTSTEHDDQSLRPLVWNSFPGRKCLLPLHGRLEGVYALQKDTAYEEHSQKSAFGPRKPTVQTQSFFVSTLEECKVRCEENHFCGIVTYEQIADDRFGCTLSLVPAATCNLQPSSSVHGVLLFPRDQSTRLTTDTQSTNRRLVFNGTRSGVVITSGNTADLWGLPNLLNLFDVIPGEDEASGDIFRHIQLPSDCDGMSTVMPDCTTPSTMDRCIRRHYPNWRGYGNLPAGWEDSPACVKNQPMIEKNLQEAVNEGFKSWMADPQKPYFGIGFTSIGFKCRAEWTSGGLVSRTRNDLREIFYESGFKMTNNNTCSLIRCKTCRVYNQPGSLPEYLDPVNFSRVHPEPESLMNRRITFPDATGTVITSGLPIHFSPSALQRACCFCR